MKKNILYIDANNLYGYAMTESLPYDEINFDRNVKLDETLDNPDDFDIGYFFEVDLSYPDNMTEKTKVFPFCPENKICNKKDFSNFMKKNET